VKEVLSLKKSFKYDTHTHTAETSKCGILSAGELVNLYSEHGYDGIVITDHMNEDFISSLECKDDWNACVDRFLYGYRQAARRGGQIGLDVVLGAEVQFEVNNSEYLIYGIDEAFLRNNPYFHRLGPWEFFERFGDELLIIHAHPCREGNKTVFFECAHGIELVNCQLESKNNNEKSLKLLKANPELHTFCASDAHRTEDVGRGWMLFNEPVPDSRTFCDAIKWGEYSLGSSTKEGKEVLRRAAALLVSNIVVERVGAKMFDSNNR